MATSPPGDTRYEVIEWDFDAASDATEYFSKDYSDEELAQSILPCYCAKRRRVPFLRDAIDIAFGAVEEGCRVGAAVFEGGELIQGFGTIFSYKEKYF